MEQKPNEEPRPEWKEDDPERIDRILALLREAWLKEPSSRLGQLIYNVVVQKQEEAGSRIFYIRDSKTQKFAGGLLPYVVGQVRQAARCLRVHTSRPRLKQQSWPPHHAGNHCGRCSVPLFRAASWQR